MRNVANDVYHDRAAHLAALSSSLTAPTVSGVWTVSTATLCWGQESIVGPVHVLATLAVTTPMGTLAMRTMPPTRSSATASRATQVNVFKNALWSFNLSAS